MAHRVLTQSSPATTGGKCGVQIGNSVLNFEECQSLDEQLGAGVDYNVLWTYVPGRPQGVLRVALDAAAPTNGYIAYGIPQIPGTMQGGSAIVVKANASAPAGKTEQEPSNFNISRTQPGAQTKFVEGTMANLLVAACWT